MKRKMGMTFNDIHIYLIAACIVIITILRLFNVFPAKTWYDIMIIIMIIDRILWCIEDYREKHK